MAAPRIDRMFCEITTDVKGKSMSAAFASEAESERLKQMRVQLHRIRTRWHDDAFHDSLRRAITAWVDMNGRSDLFQTRFNSMLDGYHDYIDVDRSRQQAADSISCPALELYCSAEGYDHLYKLVSNTLRNPEASDDDLNAAVTLVELLTIELYNLRLANRGDPNYFNFHGTVYRGMGIRAEDAAAFHNILQTTDLAKRSFSIPIGFMSASSDKATMQKFAVEYKDKYPEQMHWTIHVGSVHPDLLKVYHDTYPTSKVSSICAMPVARHSEFDEKEILLRGPMLHLINTEIVEQDGITVHKVEVMMLNNNRDHETETGQDDGEKKAQRDLFRMFAQASKYSMCSELVRDSRPADSQEYARLSDQLRNEIAPHIPHSEEQARAKYVPTAMFTWHGASNASAYPTQYADLRRQFDDAVSSGRWVEAEQCIAKDYAWNKSRWLIEHKLHGSDWSPIRPGYSTLHEIVFQGRPEKDEAEQAAWDRLLAESCSPLLPRTIASADEQHITAAALATQLERHKLADLLAPHTKHPLQANILSVLERKLEAAIKAYAGDELDTMDFVFPQVSVLCELSDPHMWIPIPRQHGGLMVELESDTLRVTCYSITPGLPQQDGIEHILRAAED